MWVITVTTWFVASYIVENMSTNVVYKIKDYTIVIRNEKTSVRRNQCLVCAKFEFDLEIQVVIYVV